MFFRNFVLMVLLFSFTIIYAQQSSLSDVAFPQNRISNNPAYLGINTDGSEFIWYGRDNFNLYSIRLGGLEIGWNDNPKGWRLGTGIHFSKNFTMGLRYSFDNKWHYQTHNIGFLVKPERHLSLGLSFLPKSDEYSVGFAYAPIERYFTFYAEAYPPKFDFNKDTPYKFGIQTEPIKGVKVFGSYDSDENVWAGLTYQMGNMSLTGASDGDNIEGFVQLSSIPYTTGLPLPLPKKILTLNFNKPIIENDTSPFNSGLPLYELISAIDKAGKSNEVKSLYINMNGFGSNFAQAEEIRNALKRFKDKGKTITVYADDLGNLGYYISSVADKIIIPPSGNLMIYGLRIEALFLKGTFDKLGVKAEFVSVGKYKSAGEMFTRTDFSEPAREEYNSILDDLYSQLINTLSDGRKLSPDSVKTLIDYGLFNATIAKSSGLVDEIMFPQVAKETNAKKSEDLLKFADKKHYDDNWGFQKKIAIIYAVGEITSVDGGFSLFGNGNISQNQFVNMIEKIRKDKSIKGVVLRIDSPGGSALASDMIHNSLIRLQEKKPLVISMGGTAASGGYFLSSTGAKIFADKNTITGSIGVISGKFVLKGLMDKIGVSIDTLQRGASANIFSPFDTLTESGRAKLENDTKYFYEIFLDRVASARSLPKDSIHTLAQGRVYTGQSAKSIGLVDSIGGLTDAINYLIENNKIGKNYKVESYPSKKNFFSFLFNKVGEVSTIIDKPKEKIEKIIPFKNGESLYLMPYHIEIK